VTLEGDETVKDDMLQRYVCYRNYAEVLRTIAAVKKNGDERDAMTVAAEDCDRMAVSLDSILRARTFLEK